MQIYGNVTGIVTGSTETMVFQNTGIPIPKEGRDDYQRCS